MDSLDALEELVTGRISGVDEFKAAEPGEFLQGAAWYLGEVARRHRGAVWRYHEDPLGYAVSGDAWAGKPYVTQSGPDANTAQPIAELRVAVRKREPGTLRALRLVPLIWSKAASFVDVRPKPGSSSSG